MTNDKLCAREGCGRKAEWAVEAHIPAKGWAIEVHQPVTLMCDMALCRDHATEEDLLKTVPEIKEVIASALAQAGLAEADFARAWTTPVRRSSPRFLDFERARAGRSH